MFRKRKHNQRIKAKQPAAPWRRRIAVSVVFLSVVISVGVLALDQLLRPDVFTVERVHYFGTFERVKPQELERTVNPTVQGNLLALDLNRVEQAARSIPWVESVIVQRRLPKALRVTITEQRLIAQWLPGGWINRLGEVVELPEVPQVATADDGATALPVANAVGGGVRKLPQLSGPRGSNAMVLARYRRWGALLAGQGLRLVRLQLTAGGSWFARVAVNQAKDNQITGTASDARTPDGNRTVDLVIGQHHAEKRLARFAGIFRDALNVRLPEAARIDLRYPNGFAVQWRTPTSTPVPTPSKGAKQA